MLTISLAIKGGEIDQIQVTNLGFKTAGSGQFQTEGEHMYEVRSKHIGHPFNMMFEKEHGVHALARAALSSVYCLARKKEIGLSDELNLNPFRCMICGKVVELELNHDCL